MDFKLRCALFTVFGALYGSLMRGFSTAVAICFRIAFRAVLFHDALLAIAARVNLFGYTCVVMQQAHSNGPWDKGWASNLN